MLLKKLHKPTMRNLLLRISIIPVIIIIVFVIIVIFLSTFYIEKTTVTNIRKSGRQLLADTSGAMKEAGENKIREHTAAIVKQAELYMKLNPAMSQRDLPLNGNFRNLVLRRSGDTGYSLVVDMEDKRILLHAIREYEGALLEEYTGDLEEYIAADKEGDFLSGYFWGKQSESPQKKIYVPDEGAATYIGQKIYWHCIHHGV